VSTGDTIIKSIEASLRSAGVDGTVVDAIITSHPNVMRLQSMRGLVSYVPIGGSDVTLTITVALRGIELKPVRGVAEFRKQEIGRAPATFTEEAL
jgi:hypothetical protein